MTTANNPLFNALELTPGSTDTRCVKLTYTGRTAVPGYRHRGALSDLGVVAVTGSVGKTTTKDLLGKVLSRLCPTTAPPGNRNRESGMPENVSRLVPGMQYLVLEVGARHVGDIRYLTSLVRAQVGVVLNVGTVHLGEFGSRAPIA